MANAPDTLVVSGPNFEQTALSAALVTPSGGTQTTMALALNGTGSAQAPASITGSVTPFPITGLAAAQGGVVSVTGGTSSTSLNAGGALNLTGGTPGLTGAGGAVVVSGGAGGATSGLGGAATLKAGAPVSGNGSAATVQGSDGAGSTNAGGDVLLVAGAAVSTGIPGRVKFNGDAGITNATYFFTGTPAATNQVFFVANRPLIITAASQVHSTAAGGTSTLTVTKDTSTNAPGAGTVIQTGSFNLNATANTVQNATLSATVATLKLAAGDRLAVVFANAIQSSVGVVVTVSMAPI